MLINEGDGLRQMAFENQDVITTSMWRQRFDTCIEVGSKDKVVIRFIVDDVTKPHDSPASSIRIDVFLYVRGAQRDPSDDAFYERVMCRQLQQEISFLKALTRLNRNTSVESRCMQERGKILRRKIPADELMRITHPDVIRIVECPEVLVAVDSHAAFSSSTAC